MAFERLKDEIGMMIAALDERAPEDKHELFLSIHAKLQELRAFGMPLPSDLVELEAVLDQELEQERLRMS